MKCTIHGTEMEYTGEDPFGGDVWFCENCHAEEEAEFERTTEDEYSDEPFDEPGEDDDFLWDEELDDDGVYEGDTVIHQPYDDDEE